MLEDGSRLEPGILSYLLPGCGFGGSCFPKDVRSLLAFGSQMGASLPVLEAVMEVNETQPQRMVELLKRRIPNLSQVPVAILGVAFKPGTDDVRESPAIRIAEDLLSEGATVTIVDPVANDQARGSFLVGGCHLASLNEAHSHSDGGSQVEVGLWCVVVQRLGKQQRIARPPPARGDDRGRDHRDTTRDGSVFFESNVGDQY